MRLIDADALMEEIRYFSVWVMKWNENRSLCREVLSETKKSYLDLLEESPTIDAELVRHGHWIKDRDALGIDRGWKCSECRCSVYQMTVESYGYCPHCGAKMDEEAEHE